MLDGPLREIEELVEDLRSIHSPKVRDVLGLLSLAEQAYYTGDMDKFNIYKKRALEYEVR